MRVDLIKVLRELFEKQGYDVDEDDIYLFVSDEDVSFDGTLILVKDKAEKFLMDIYSKGREAGYKKGLVNMRHMQATMKGKKDEQKA